MIFIGKIISVSASIILITQWRKLNRVLKSVHMQYCTSIKSVIPNSLIWALICGEDRRHFSHRGVDLIAIVRAIWKFLVYQKREGGSTIEQQLIRTVTGCYQLRLSRKIKEILLATLIQNVIPKEDIAGVYLSIAYFGWRMNGVLQACRRLEFDMQFLTYKQASSIIARLKYPEPQKTSPLRQRQIYIRNEYIFRMMKKYKKVTIPELTNDAILNEPLSNF